MKDHHHHHHRQKHQHKKKKKQKKALPTIRNENIWFQYFNLLKEFKTEHNHCNVPYRTHGKLGDWVVRQRTTYRKNEILLHRRQLLEEIGFVWKVRERGVGWDFHYNRLKMFYEVHGHLNVPYKNDTKKLYGWIRRQKDAYIAQTIQPRRQRLLDELPFIWTTTTTTTTTGRHHHSNSNVVVTKSSNNNNNDDVVQEQKQKQKQNPPANCTKRNDIYDKHWYEQYECLQKFREENGHCDISQRSNGKLGTWVSTQRNMYRKGLLRQDRLELLNDIGFEWRSKRAKRDDQKRRSTSAAATTTTTTTTVGQQHQRQRRKISSTSTTDDDDDDDDDGSSESEDDDYDASSITSTPKTTTTRAATSFSSICTTTTDDDDDDDDDVSSSDGDDMSSIFSTKARGTRKTAFSFGEIEHKFWI